MHSNGKSYCKVPVRTKAMEALNPAFPWLKSDVKTTIISEEVDCISDGNMIPVSVFIRLFGSVELPLKMYMKSPL